MAIEMYEVGTRYLFILSHGWGLVGTFAERNGINDVILTDSYFVTRCGDDTDWGRFVRNGPGEHCIVNKLGDRLVINLDHRLWDVPYTHELPETR
ncbi:MAG: hypothetical protein ACFCD0_13805 [Gemmataceae bacterium]